MDNKRITEMCDSILGPIPVIGKTAIESSHQAHYVGEQSKEQPGRCLSLGSTTQKQKHLTQPGACSRNPDLEDPFCKIQQDLNLV